MLVLMLVVCSCDHASDSGGRVLVVAARDRRARGSARLLVAVVVVVVAVPWDLVILVVECSCSW
jgi:hypothetical protein